MSIGGILATTLAVASVVGPSATAQQATPPDPFACYAIADDQGALPGGGSGDDADDLVKLDRDSAATQIIGATGTTDIESMAFRLDPIGGDNTAFAVNGGTLGIIDLGTGNYAAIGPAGTAAGDEGPVPLFDLDGLTYDAQRDILWASHRRVDNALDLLVQIDPATGAHIDNAFGPGRDYVAVPAPDQIDPTWTDIDDIAVDPVDGDLFVIANLGGAGGALVKVDAATGAIQSQIGSFATGNPANPIVDDMEGLAFFNDGRMYGSTGNNGPDPVDLNKLFIIDQFTAATTEIGAFPDTFIDYEALGCLTGNAVITLEKLVEGVDADAAPGPAILVGEPVTFTYQIDVVGLVEVGSLVLVDDVLGVLNDPTAADPIARCEEGLISSLPPNGSATCTITETAVAGPYRNVGSVTGVYDTPRGPVVLTAQDPAHYTGLVPSVDIEKATNGADADDPGGADVPTLVVGETAEFTYVVTNTGDVDLVDIVVSDDQGVEVTCPATTLAPSASITCTGSASVVAGVYTNIGSIVAQPVDDSGAPVGPPVTDDDPSNHIGLLPGEPSIDIEKATNGADADDPAGPDVPAIEVGQTAEFTYLITNTGALDLVDIVVTDDQGVEVSCPATFLAVGASMTCTGSATVVAGPYTNVGTVTGQGLDGNGEPVGDPVTDDDPSNHIGLLPGEPSIDIEKATNGADADDPTGADVPFVPVGDPVEFTYVVTNSGALDLVEIVVTDDQGVEVTCPATTLGPGESMTCTGSGVAEEGPYTNVGSVAAQPIDPVGEPVGGPITDDDPSNHVGAAPGIDVEKATNGADADDANGADVPVLPVGSIVTWTYLVTNTGNTDLVDVAVVDDQGVAVSCPGTTLTPGESMICTASGEAVDGQYTNVGSVSGQPVDPSGEPITEVVTDDDPSNYLGSEAAIALEKTVLSGAGDCSTAVEGLDELVVSEPGTAVTYCFTVTNTGGLHLSPVTIDDPTLGVTEVDMTLVSGDAAGPLAPGAVLVYSLPGTIPEGGVVNTATATGTPTDAAGNELGLDPVTSVNDAEVGAIGIALEKTVVNEGIDCSEAVPGVDEVVAGATGDPITYCFSVTNTGGLHLFPVTIDDPTLGISTADLVVVSGDPSVPLAPGASLLYAYSSTVPEAALVNVATAGGTPTDEAGTPIPGVDPPTDDDVAEVLPAAIRLEKLVRDNTDGAADCLDLDEGGPGIDMPDDRVTNVEGTPVIYCFRVVNTGGTGLNELTIGDPDLFGGDVLIAEGVNLEPGEDYTYPAQAGEIDGILENVATVTGNPTYPAGTEQGSVGGQPGTDIPGAPNPTDSNSALTEGTGIEVAKTVAAGDAVDCSTLENGVDELVIGGPGDVVTFCFEVINTGSLPLADVVVNDPILGLQLTVDDADLPLQPGQSVTLSAETEINGDVTNTADASGQPVDVESGEPVGEPVSASDDARTEDLEADVAIEKTLQDPLQAGSTADYGLEITNLGPDPAVEVVVTDDLPAPLTLASTPSGDGWDCSASTQTTVSCSRPLLEVDEVTAIAFSVNVAAGFGGATITNVSSVETETPESNLENNQDDAQGAYVEVQASVQLPATGVDTGRMVLYSAGLMLLGGLLLLPGRRETRLRGHGG